MLLVNFSCDGSDDTSTGPPPEPPLPPPLLVIIAVGGPKLESDPSSARVIAGVGPADDPAPPVSGGSIPSPSGPTSAPPCGSRYIDKPLA